MTLTLISGFQLHLGNTVRLVVDEEYFWADMFLLRGSQDKDILIVYESFQVVQSREWG